MLCRDAWFAREDRWLRDVHVAVRKQFLYVQLLIPLISRILYGPLVARSATLTLLLSLYATSVTVLLILTIRRFHELLLARFNAERTRLEFGITVLTRLLAVVLQSIVRLLRIVAIAVGLLCEDLVADLTNHVAAAGRIDEHGIRRSARALHNTSRVIMIMDWSKVRLFAKNVAVLIWYTVLCHWGGNRSSSACTRIATSSRHGRKAQLWLGLLVLRRCHLLLVQYHNLLLLNIVGARVLIDLARSGRWCSDRAVLDVNLSASSVRLYDCLLGSLWTVLQITNLSLRLAATLTNTLDSCDDLFVFFSRSLLIFWFHFQLETAFITSVTRSIRAPAKAAVTVRIERSLSDWGIGHLRVRSGRLGRVGARFNRALRRILITNLQLLVAVVPVRALDVSLDFHLIIVRFRDSSSGNLPLVGLCAAIHGCIVVAWTITLIYLAYVTVTMWLRIMLLFDLPTLGDLLTLSLLLT